MVANLEAFYPGEEVTLSDQLTTLREQGQLVAGYPITVAAGEFATFYAAENTVLSDATPEGISRYTITDVSTDNSTVTLAALSGIVAGATPMLVYNGTDDDQTVIIMRTTDAADANDVDIYSGFNGTAEETTIAASTTTQTNYACNGREFVVVRSNLSVPANKCWLEVPVSTANAARTLNIVFEGETTEIAQIENGKLKIDNSVYDLQGRRVNGQWSMVNRQLKKGVYVKDGRKVVK